MKKTTPPSKAMLELAKSLSFNAQNYIPKGGVSFSLFKVEILSGLTVALALVPEAIAFAFVPGVAPLSGLYAAFIVGLITAVFGGRPGMISGATGALAVVMVSLVTEHGAEYLFATVVLMGVLQLLAGVFKLGKFVRLIPHPVMMGFVNGLAIVIFLSQLGLFKETVNGESQFMTGQALWTMLGFVALTMGIMYGLPKLTKKIPAALLAIIVVACITIFGGIEVSTVGSFIKDGGGEGLQGTSLSIDGDVTLEGIVDATPTKALGLNASDEVVSYAVNVPRVTSVTSTATLTIDSSTTDQAVITAQSGNLTI